MIPLHGEGKRIESLRKRIEVLSVRKRRLLALLAMTELDQNARIELGKLLDATLVKLRYLTIELSALE